MLLSLSLPPRPEPYKVGRQQSCSDAFLTVAAGIPGYLFLFSRRTDGCLGALAGAKRGSTLS